LEFFGAERISDEDWDRAGELIVVVVVIIRVSREDEATDESRPLGDVSEPGLSELVGEPLCVSCC